MHISILPIKDPLNLNGRVVAIDCCCTAGWKAKPASERERKRDTEPEKRGWRDDKRRGLQWEVRREETAGLRLNVVNLKDGGKEI